MRLKASANVLDGSLLVRVTGRDFTVPTLAAAAEVVRCLVEEEGIEHDEGHGAEVRDEQTRAVVAVVGHDGRVWIPKLDENGQYVPRDVEFDLDA